MESTLKIAIETSVQIPIQSAIGEIETTFISFTGLDDPHFAIQLGTLDRDKAPLVRIHSECATGDIFGSLRCDCGPQLQEAIVKIHNEGGYIIYLRQEGRGIGLNSKLRAYKEQDKGLDTFMANQVLGFPDDARDLKLPAELLKALGVQKLRLLSNNPDKFHSLVESGLDVIERVPTGKFENPKNKKYLDAKRTQKNHNLSE
ncbi:MAG: GTP cyclohydrolase II RibA [Pseudomonadota bacterium]